MKQISRDNYFEALDASRAGHHNDYYSMYSSLLNGISTDPLLMQIPVDDHVVHRGDGVFETFKCVDGAIYNLTAHLSRFEKSATLLHFDMKWSVGEVQDLVIATIQASRQRDCAIRLMLSRGPGSFTVNPYDCVGPQLYIIVSKLKKGFMELHPEGATLGVSKVSAKLSFFARVKNCNYLPNVLMQKEAVDMGVDFVVGFDSRGIMTEGACENIGIITKGAELAFPTLDAILCGTTMMRVADLGRTLAQKIGISSVSLRDITQQEMHDAAEIIVVGTTPNVTSVRQFDKKPLPGKTPGPIADALNRAIIRDIQSNTQLRTMI